MTFKQVIMKNFIRGIRKYISYFLSGVFCVSMFFIYSAMMMLDAVTESTSEYPMFLLFIVTCILISLFSIFFLSYSHGNFIRNKKKELGLYMILGMDENEMCRMLLFETTIIAFASILAGIITDSVLSKYFQLIVQKIMDIDKIQYKLTIFNFVLTIAVFIVIYGICFFISFFKIKKEELIEIIKENRKKESRAYKKRDAVISVIAIVLMIFSVIFILNVANDSHINSKLWVMLTFLGSGYIGLFLLIAYGGKTFIHSMKKSRGYYGKMLSVTEIDYKYHQNVRIIIILSILASMVVLLVGSPIALVSISEDIAEDCVHDIEYASMQNYDSAKVDMILNQNKIDSFNKFEKYYCFVNSQELKIVESVSEYNKSYGTALQIKKGEVYNLVTTWQPGTNGVIPGSVYTIGNGSETFSFNVSDSVKGEWDYPNLIPSSSVLILSDEDYQNIKDKLPKFYIGIVSYSNGWKNTKYIVDELTGELGLNSFVNSRIGQYRNLKSGYSVFLFVTCSMSFMFLISTGFVLYFKQYNDIEEEKQQYRRLYNIGISDKEMKRSISVKMAVVYFVPVLGSIMGILIMYYMSSLFGGHDITIQFMKKGIIGLGCYFVSQFLFYIILKVKYVKEVCSSIEN